VTSLDSIVACPAMLGAEGETHLGFRDLILFRRYWQRVMKLVVGQVSLIEQLMNFSIQPKLYDNAF
jgi:hypothetical protein